MALKFSLDRGGMHIYPWYISEISSTRDIAKITDGTVVKESFFVIEKDFLKGYYDIESTNKIGEYLFKRIKDDPDFYKEIIDNIYKYSRELEEFSTRVSQMKNLKQLGNEELVATYREYVDRLNELRVWGWVPPFVDGLEISYLTNYISEKLREHLKTLGREDKFGEYYSILSSSEKMSEVQQEELARLKIILDIEGQTDAKETSTAIQAGDPDAIQTHYPDIYKLLAEHTQQFGWLPYAFSGPAMTIEQLLGLISDNLKAGDIKAQQDKLISHYKNIGQEKQAIATEIKLPAQLEYLLNVSAELMFIKDYRKGIYQKSYVAMDGIMAEIAHRLGLGIKGVKYMILPEVEEALANEQKAQDYVKRVELRMEKCCFLSRDGKIQVFEGKACDELIAKLIPSTDEEAESDNITEIRGMVAYSGKVQGTVKIVLVKKDIAKMKRGDILVSSATNPDLIVAMKKAAAFVTDMGGITSHAAIVSRELKKPCVVGTKRATHILKDGDLIEVDANEGIVRIIKRIK